MAKYVLFALLNGVFIGLSRVLNGRYAKTKSAVEASILNHIGGLFIIAIICMASSNFTFVKSLSSVPWPYFLGGVIGAGFVAANSKLIPVLGSMQTILLVISGQMIGGSILDASMGHTKSYPLQFLGVALIIAGIFMAQRESKRS